MSSNKNKNSILKNASSTAREDITISLVGPQGCGKSALLVKYITHRFIGEYDPFYEGCWSKHENLDGIDLNVQVMDTYDKDRKNLEKYLRWSDAVIVVFSILSSQSFRDVQDYLEKIQEITKKISDETNGRTATKIILLGNKIDMERYRQVSKLDIEIVLEKYSNTGTIINSLSSSPNAAINESNTGFLNISYFEATSCEEYELIQNLFYKVIREIRRDRESYQLLNPLQISEENASLTSTKVKSRLNSAFSSSKRAKSPKNSNSISLDNQSNVILTSNQNSPIVTSGNGSSNAAAANVGGPLNTVPSSSNFSTTANVGVPANSGATGKEAVKKNSSKFPFFNKILNKS